MSTERNVIETVSYGPLFSARNWIPSERAHQEEQNCTILSTVAFSSDEIHVCVWKGFY